MRPPGGRNVEVEGGMAPVGESWIFALGYCAVTFTALWIAIFVARSTGFILSAGLFAAYGFAYLYKATRATLDARMFGAMRLRAAAVAPAAVGGRFTGSLRISESAAVHGTLRAELRCVRVWFGLGRNEEVVWSEERSFPIRHQPGGSYAILEFGIPPGLPASEAPPPLAPNMERGRQFTRWELQALAEAGGAFRDELYTIIVAPGQTAAAPAGDPDSLPMELQRSAPPEVVAPLPSAAASAPDSGPYEIVRGAPPKAKASAKAPRPVETTQNLAEPEVAPPRDPDPAAVVLLVAANLVPLAGVAFWGWQIWQVVFLYWMENLIIGGFNVLRILAAGRKPEDASAHVPLRAGRLGLAAFFTIHYGGFCFVHGIFLAAFMGRGGGAGRGDLGDTLLRTLQDPVAAAALAALLVSHGWSFFRNYLGRGEYERADAGELMHRPYRRIVVTHVFIIFGGFLVMSTGGQLLPMLLFVGLKIGSDLYFHVREHRGQSAL